MDRMSHQSSVSSADALSLLETNHALSSENIQLKKQIVILQQRAEVPKIQASSILLSSHSPSLDLLLDQACSLGFLNISFSLKPYQLRTLETFKKDSPIEKANLLVLQQQMLIDAREDLRDAQLETFLMSEASVLALLNEKQADSSLYEVFHECLYDRTTNPDLEKSFRVLSNLEVIKQKLLISNGHCSPDVLETQKTNTKFQLLLQHLNKVAKILGAKEEDTEIKEGQDVFDRIVLLTQNIHLKSKELVRDKDRLVRAFPDAEDIDDVLSLARSIGKVSIDPKYLEMEKSSRKLARILEENRTKIQDLEKLVCQKNEKISKNERLLVYYKQAYNKIYFQVKDPENVFNLKEENSALALEKEKLEGEVRKLEEWIQDLLDKNSDLQTKIDYFHHMFEDNFPKTKENDNNRLISVLSDKIHECCYMLEEYQSKVNELLDLIDKQTDIKSVRSVISSIKKPHKDSIILLQVKEKSGDSSNFYDELAKMESKISSFRIENRSLLTNRKFSEYLFTDSDDDDTVKTEFPIVHLARQLLNEIEKKSIDLQYSAPLRKHLESLSTQISDNFKIHNLILPISDSKNSNEIEKISQDLFCICTMLKDMNNILGYDESEDNLKTLCTSLRENLCKYREESKDELKNVLEKLDKRESEQKKIKNSLSKMGKILGITINKGCSNLKALKAIKTSLKTTENTKLEAKDKRELVWILLNTRSNINHQANILRSLYQYASESVKSQLLLVLTSIEGTLSMMDENTLVEKSLQAFPSENQDKISSKILKLANEHSELKDKEHSISTQIRKLKTEFDVNFNSFEEHKQKIVSEFAQLDDSILVESPLKSAKIAIILNRSAFAQLFKAFSIWKSSKLILKSITFPGLITKVNNKYRDISLSHHKEYLQSLTASNMLLKEVTLKKKSSTDYLSLFKLLEETFYKKHLANIKAFRAGAKPSSYTEFLLETIPQKKLSNLLAGLQILSQQLHPYAQFFCSLLQIFTEFPIPYSLSIFLTNFNLRLEEIVDKLSARIKQNSFEKAGHGGSAYLADVIDLIYANFTREAGVFILEKLQKISPKDYLAFLISHRIHHKKLAPLNVLAKIKKKHIVSQTDVLAICESDLDVWVSSNLVCASMNNKDLKSSEFCNWVSISNYIKNRGLFLVKKCDILNAIVEFYHFLQVKDGAFLWTILENYPDMISENLFCKIIEKELKATVSEHPLFEQTSEIAKEEVFKFVMNSAVGGIGLGPFCISNMYEDVAKSQKQSEDDIPEEPKVILGPLVKEVSVSNKPSTFRTTRKRLSSKNLSIKRK